MNCFIERTLKFIYSKRKQIVFALFAIICIILDKDNSTGLLRAAAPAVVAAAAAGSSTATGAAGASAAAGAASGGTSAAGTASSAAATASNAEKGREAATKVKGSIDATQKADVKPNNFNNNVPRNTNPKTYKSETLSSTTVNKNDVISAPNGLTDETSRATQKASGKTDVENETKKSKKNSRLNPELNKDNDTEEEEVIMDNAAEEVTKDAGGMAVGCIFAVIFIIIFSVPLTILLIINADTSTLSQVNCSLLSGGNCVEEESDAGFFEKLKNLFVYGAYGSNSEVVLKEIEDSYTEIKEEYDFIISLPLLVSSLFSDSEYIKTEVEGGNIVITDKMMDRVQYIYDTALLQLIPKYNVYSCHAELVDEQYNIYSYTPTYEYTLTPTYDEGDTTEAIAETIPTGVCDASTAGSIYKEVIYYFDLEKYFKRLKISEELDLVYADYVEADKLLVSKIQNQYILYMYINQIEDVATYADVPLQLEHDESVNLQTPLSGSYAITSQFGMRDGEYAGMHNGIDLVSNDKNIYSAGTGVVTRSNVETEGGNVIEITHTDSSGKQYVTQYAHLSSRLVNVGDTVSSGDVIGIMGDTGTMASGVHLHFSMWENEPYELLNPRKLFSEASNY